MNNVSQQELADPWTDHMRRGDFMAAWEHSDRLLQLRCGEPCWHLPRHLQYVWNGSSLHGKKVLVRCYHGLGDTIQFIRYVPLLRRIAGEVIVWAQPKLLRLLETVDGIDELLPLHDGTPGVEFDADIELMELPHIFRTTLQTIPVKIPYLHVEPTRFPQASDQLSVGLVWRAGDWDECRSLSLPVFHPLSAVPGIQFYILQPEAIAAGWTEGFGIYKGEFDLYEYARVISGLDLLISIDSMPVHLAGALGTPVWTLLHTAADWRWMQDRDDSPWYPTMHLFRQRSPGDWPEVISRVVPELKKFVEKNRKIL